MDGLTNIIAKIHEQNDAECQNIISSAKEKAETILADAREEADRIINEISSLADSEIKVLNARAVSASEVEYKRAVLAKKSELLDRAVDNAVESIKNCSDEVYFEYIEKLIVQHALHGNGVVSMSQRDISRLPEGFVSKVNCSLSDGKRIEISSTAVPFDCGFVIDYPEMRVDCTFTSLINDKMDEIRDELSRVLFA